MGLDVMLPIILGFIITFFLELGVVYLFFRKSIPSKKIWLIVLLANLFTWPLINAFGSRYSLIVLVLLEAAVCAVEAGIFYEFFDKRAGRSALASVIANALSAILGNIFFATILYYVIISVALPA